MKKFLKGTFLFLTVLLCSALLFACGNPAITKISLSVNNQAIVDGRYYVYVGSAFDINATLAPTDAVKGDIVWESNNIEIATVNNKGSVIPRKSGDFTITASFKNDASIKASLNFSAFVKSEVLKFQEESYVYSYGEAQDISLVENGLLDFNTVSFTYFGTMGDNLHTLYPSSNIAPKNVGIYTVVASSTALPNERTTATLEIIKRDVSITAPNFYRTYGTDENNIHLSSDDSLFDFSNSIVANSANNTRIVGNDSIEYFVTSAGVQMFANAGNYQVVPVINTDNYFNYNITRLNGTLSVTPLDVVLEADGAASAVYGSEPSVSYNLYKASDYSFTLTQYEKEEINLLNTQNHLRYASGITFSYKFFKEDSLFTGIKEVCYDAGEIVSGYDINCADSTPKLNTSGTVNLRITQKLPGKLTITPKPLLITPVSNQSKIVGESDPGVFEFTTRSGDLVYGDAVTLAREEGENVAENGYYFSVESILGQNNEDRYKNYSIEYAAGGEEFRYITGNKFFINPINVYYSVADNKYIAYTNTPDDAYQEIYQNGQVAISVVEGANSVAVENLSASLRTVGSTKYRIVLSSELGEAESASAQGHYARHKINLTTALYSTTEQSPIATDWTLVENDTNFNFIFDNLNSKYVYLEKIDLIINPVETTIVYGEAEATIDFSLAGVYESDTEANLKTFISLTRNDFDKKDVGEYEIILNTASTNLNDYGYYNLVLNNENSYIITPAEITVSIKMTEDNENCFFKYYGGTETLTSDNNILNYNDADYANKIMYSVSGLKFDDSVAETLSGTLSRTINENVGAYAFDFSTFNVVSNNYMQQLATSNESNYTFDIYKRPIAIYANSYTITYGDTLPDLSYTYVVAEGEKTVGESTVNFGAFLRTSTYTPTFIGGLATSATSSSAPASYTITRPLENGITTNDNFLVTFVDGTLTIVKKNASISLIAENRSSESGAPTTISNISHNVTGFLPNVTSTTLDILTFGFDETNPNLPFYFVDFANAENFIFEVTLQDSTVLSYDNDLLNYYEITFVSNIAFYIESEVVNIYIRNGRDASTNTVNVTYNAQRASSTLFDAYLVSETVRFRGTPTFVYRKVGEPGSEIPPTNAGVYIVTIKEDSLAFESIATGDLVEITPNIVTTGRLIIAKANYQTLNNIEENITLEFSFNYNNCGYENDTALSTHITSLLTACDDLSLTVLGLPQFIKGTNYDYNEESLSVTNLKSLPANSLPMIYEINIHETENFFAIRVYLEVTVNQIIIDMDGYATPTFENSVPSVYVDGATVPNKLTGFNSEIEDKISVLYSYVGVKYISEDEDHLGCILAYKETEYLDSTKKVYFETLNYEFFDFTRTTASYFVYVLDLQTYFIPLNHFAGAPSSAGVYQVTATISSANSNYTLAGRNSYSTPYQIEKGQINIRNWQTDFSYGYTFDVDNVYSLSEFNIVNNLSYNLNPLNYIGTYRVSYVFSFDVDLVSKIIDINDAGYPVEIVVNSANYYCRNTTNKIKIVKLTVEFDTTAIPKTYFSHGTTNFSLINFVKIKLYNLGEELTNTLRYSLQNNIEFFKDSELTAYINPVTEVDATVTKEIFAISNWIDEQTYELVAPVYGEGGLLEAGDYVMQLTYNDLTHQGSTRIIFSIELKNYESSITFNGNGLMEFNPDVTSEEICAILSSMYSISIPLPAEEYTINYYCGNNITPSGLINNTSANILIKNVGTYEIILNIKFLSNSIKEIVITNGALQVIRKNFTYGDGIGFSFSPPSELWEGINGRPNEFEYTSSFRNCYLTYNGSTICLPDAQYNPGQFTYLLIDYNVTIIYSYSLDDQGIYTDLDNAPISPGNYKVTYTFNPGANCSIDGNYSQNIVRSKTFLINKASSCTISVENYIDSTAFTYDPLMDQDLIVPKVSFSNAQVSMDVVINCVPNYMVYSPGSFNGVVFQRLFTKTKSANSWEIANAAYMTNAPTTAGNYYVFYRFVGSTSFFNTLYVSGSVVTIDKSTSTSTMPPTYGESYCVDFVKMIERATSYNDPDGLNLSSMEGIVDIWFAGKLEIKQASPIPVDQISYDLKVEEFRNDRYVSLEQNVNAENTPESPAYTFGYNISTTIYLDSGIESDYLFKVYYISNSGSAVLISDSNGNYTFTRQYTNYGKTHYIWVQDKDKNYRPTFIYFEVGYTPINIHVIDPHEGVELDGETQRYTITTTYKTTNWELPNFLQNDQSAPNSVYKFIKYTQYPALGVNGTETPLNEWSSHYGVGHYYIKVQLTTDAYNLEHDLLVEYNILPSDEYTVICNNGWEYPVNYGTFVDPTAVAKSTQDNSVVAGTAYFTFEEILACENGEAVDIIVSNYLQYLNANNYTLYYTNQAAFEAMLDNGVLSYNGVRYPNIPHANINTVAVGRGYVLRAIFVPTSRNFNVKIQSCNLSFKVIQTPISPVSLSFALAEIKTKSSYNAEEHSWVYTRIDLLDGYAGTITYQLTEGGPLETSTGYVYFKSLYTLTPEIIEQCFAADDYTLQMPSPASIVFASESIALTTTQTVNNWTITLKKPTYNASAIIDPGYLYANASPSDLQIDLNSLIKAAYRNEVVTGFSGGISIEHNGISYLPNESNIVTVEGTTGSDEYTMTLKLASPKFDNISTVVFKIVKGAVALGDIYYRKSLGAGTTFTHNFSDDGTLLLCYYDRKFYVYDDSKTSVYDMVCLGESLSSGNLIYIVNGEEWTLEQLSESSYNISDTYPPFEDTSQSSITYLDLEPLQQNTYRIEISPTQFVGLINATRFLPITVRYANEYSYYSLRDEIYMPSENQGDSGLCWAYTANNVIESYLAKTTRQDYNLSEYWLAIAMANYKNNYAFGDGLTYGYNTGTYEMMYGFSDVISVLSASNMLIENENSSFAGTAGVYATLHNQLVTSTGSTITSALNNYYSTYISETVGFDLTTLKGIHYNYSNDENIPLYGTSSSNMTSVECNIEDVKTYLRNYGSLYTTINSNDITISSTLYSTEHKTDSNENANHAVTIIGFDDGRLINGEAGAWIALNSWGDHTGGDNDSIVYISYNDANVMFWGLSGIEPETIFNYGENIFELSLNSSMTSSYTTYLKNKYKSDGTSTSAPTQTCNIFDYGDTITLEYDYEKASSQEISATIYNLGVLVDSTCYSINNIKDGNYAGRFIITSTEAFPVGIFKIVFSCGTNKYRTMFEVVSGTDIDMLLFAEGASPTTFTSGLTLSTYHSSELTITITKVEETCNYVFRLYSNTYSKINNISLGSLGANFTTSSELGTLTTSDGNLFSRGYATFVINHTGDCNNGTSDSIIINITSTTGHITTLIINIEQAQ